MEISKESKCLKCANLITITKDELPSINRNIVLVECKEEVYAFPLPANSPCACFKDEEK